MLPTLISSTRLGVATATVASLPSDSQSGDSLQRAVRKEGRRHVNVSVLQHEHRVPTN